jgi:hypothetical protein
MIRCVALFCTWGRGSYHSGRNHQKVRNIKPYQNTAPPQTDRTIRKARTLEMMWKARIELPSWKYVSIYLGISCSKLNTDRWDDRWQVQVPATPEKTEKLMRFTSNLQVFSLSTFLSIWVLAINSILCWKCPALSYLHMQNPSWVRRLEVSISPRLSWGSALYTGETLAW